MHEDKKSRQIGSVLGPTLIAVTTSEWMNLDIWSENIPPMTYLNGMILFAVGLGVVRFHNQWRPMWTLSITIVGWLMIAGGFFRLFFPTSPQADASPATYAFIVLLGVLGVIMTIKSYAK